MGCCASKVKTSDTEDAPHHPSSGQEVATDDSYSHDLGDPHQHDQYHHDQYQHDHSHYDYDGHDEQYPDHHHHHVSTDPHSLASTFQDHTGRVGDGTDHNHDGADHEHGGADPTQMVSTIQQHAGAAAGAFSSVVSAAKTAQKFYQDHNDMTGMAKDGLGKARDVYHQHGHDGTDNYGVEDPHDNSDNHNHGGVDPSQMMSTLQQHAGTATSAFSGVVSAAKTAQKYYQDHKDSDMTAIAKDGLGKARDVYHQHGHDGTDHGGFEHPRDDVGHPPDNSDSHNHGGVDPSQMMSTLQHHAGKAASAFSGVVSAAKTAQTFYQHHNDSNMTTIARDGLREAHEAYDSHHNDADRDDAAEHDHDEHHGSIDTAHVVSSLQDKAGAATSAFSSALSAAKTARKFYQDHKESGVTAMARDGLGKAHEMYSQHDHQQH